MSRWFYFDQNNSGGSMVHDLDEGIGAGVFIEAKNRSHALERAGRIGLYFDGVEIGEDCPCCGDRWSNFDCEEGDVPTMYGKEWRPVEENEAPQLGYDGVPYYIHPLEGPFVKAKEVVDE